MGDMACLLQKGYQLHLLFSKCRWIKSWLAESTTLNKKKQFFLIFLPVTVLTPYSSERTNKKIVQKQAQKSNGFVSKLVLFFYNNFGICIYKTLDEALDL